jgi:hypothetical protein
MFVLNGDDDDDAGCISMFCFGIVTSSFHSFIDGAVPRFQDMSPELGRAEDRHVVKGKLHNGLEMDTSMMMDTSRFAKFFHKDQVDGNINDAIAYSTSQIPKAETIQNLDEESADKRDRTVVLTPAEKDCYDPMNEELVKSVLKSMDVAETEVKAGVKLIKRRVGEHSKEIDVKVPKESKVGSELGYLTLVRRLDVAMDPRISDILIWTSSVSL